MKPFPFPRFFLACGALSCALALASCSSNSAENTAISEGSTEIVSNAMAPNLQDNNAIDDQTVDENANAAQSNVVKFAALERIYVPGKDDLLHETKVSRMAIDSQLKSGDLAAPGLQEIIEKSPTFFPKNAKINRTEVSSKGMTIDLNQAFANDGFWRTKGEKVTELAVYALVNSASRAAGAQSTGKPESVMFTIEKKPATTLGEFDVDGAIEPQMRLVASK